MAKQKDIEKSATTEQRIKEAAKKVFTERGYAATRTRDIANEAGINLALLNYYFRSKENLFNIIMLENLHLFVGSIIEILNNRATSLEEKIEILVSHYIDMLVANPNIPVFIINAVNNNPDELIDKLRKQNDIGKTYLEEQWQELMKRRKVFSYNPIHLFINIIGLTVFPFVGAPLIKARNGISNDDYRKLMLERKKLIPVWVKTMMDHI